MNLQIFGIKLAAAKKGHSLLKRKLDALKSKFKGINKELIDQKKRLGDEAKMAFLALNTAKWSAGEIGPKVIDSQKGRSNVKLNQRYDNVAGVRLPKFTIRELSDGDEVKLGMYGGAGDIENCTKTFKELLRIVVAIASLQTSFVN